MSVHQERLALRALVWAAESTGPREKRILLERALERTRADDIRLRSCAVLVAIALPVFGALERWNAVGDDGAMRGRVVEAVADALRVGVDAAAEYLGRRFIEAGRGGEATAP